MVLLMLIPSYPLSTGSSSAARGSRGGRAQRRGRPRLPGRAVRGVSGGAREHQGSNARGHRAHGRGSPKPGECGNDSWMLFSRTVYLRIGFE